ncbi:class I SAM-dependent methyltransferase [Streptomyces sp. AJS327]|nr:class I SAM-dependent methyltransferase [Streptomyces sp. AJS327]
MYDQFGEMLAMTLGSSAVHVGMLIPPGRHTPVTDLVGLADHGQDLLTEYLIDTIELAPGARLLDVGCGTGGPAVRLAERSGGRVTGINVSEVQLAECAQRARAAGLTERLRFAYGNAMDLRYPDASFDAAWSIDCFPHLSDRPAALRELHRVLRPGSRLLITEFAQRGSPDPEELAAYQRLWSSREPTALSALLADVEQAGFRTVETWDMTSNIALSGEFMHSVYQDRREAMVARYGEAAVAFVDPLIAPFRSYCRDHMDYHLLLLRKPTA